MKHYLRYLFMLLCAWTCVLMAQAAETKIISTDELKAGVVVKIYPYSHSVETEYALCCNNATGYKLIQRYPNATGYTWLLIDAGDGCFYLENDNGYYLANTTASTDAMTCTNDISSAAKIEIKDNTKYVGFTLWNKVTGYGLKYIDNRRYNWYSSSNNYNDSSYSTFVFTKVKGDDINYIFDEVKQEASVTKGNYMGNVMIPEQVTYKSTTYTVAGVGKSAFASCKMLASVKLPNSITSIGDSAFYECEALASINIPSCVKSIGKSAFYNCFAITAVVLPNSVKSIGIEAFRGCTKLASINIPESITTIDNKTFYDCWSLKTIELPSTLTEIGGDAFYTCYALESMVIHANTPPTLGAFPFPASLKTVYVPGNTVDSYKNSSKMWSIRNVLGIIEMVSEIKVKQTKSIQIEAKYADDQTLTWSSSNTSVATVTQTGIVTGVALGTATVTAKTTDGSGVKASTTVTVCPPPAESLSLPAELTMLRATSEQLSATIAPVATGSQTLSWKSSDESVATVTQDGVVKGINIGTAVITATTTDGSNLSASCTVTVKPVAIELSTKTINLQRGATYAEQVLTIKPDTYPNKTLNWKSLDATIASVASDGTMTAVAPGVSTIRYSLQDDENVYADCKIIVYEKEVDNKEVVYVGGIYYILDDKNSTATVTSIYGGKNYSLDATKVAQVYSGTINIPETIVYDGKMYTVTAVGSYAFNCQNDLQSIYVPRTVTTIEANAAIKAENLNRVNVADQSQLVNIGSQAFQDCASLKRFTFDGSTTQMSSIDNAAFKNCKALETVKWMGESTIKSIGGSAFYGCSVLNNVELPNSVLSIGNSAFRYNSGLKEIHLSTSLNYIDEYAFGECGFSNITLPESLANIQAGAFINNEHLQKIALPEHLQGLGSAAFENNSALTSVTFRTNIETMTIGNNAFNLCPVLTKVYISSLKSFAQTNFNNAKANPANTSQHIYDAAGNEIINVVLPSGTKYVNNNAFNGCAYIESIEMPATMDHLNDNIIMGCSALKDVYCYAETVPDFIGTEDPADMDNVFKQATLHVLNGKEAVYKANNWWGRFSKTEGCNAPVVVEKVTSIVLNQTEATLYVDDTIQLSATVAPTTAANKDVTWTSSNDNVAMVTSDGYVLAVAVGEADIKATAADGSGVTATCHIKVETKKTPVVTIVSIAFAESNVTVPAGETKQLVVTYNPENATNKTLTWSSAKPAVATVDSEGNVTGVSEGKTIITAKTIDGSNKTINCVVTVTKTTGIDETSEEGVHIVLNDRHLSVTGLANGESLYVSDIAGHTIYHGTNHEIDIPSCGVYIIKVKGQTTKLCIK